MDEFILVHQTCMRKSQLFTVSMRQQVPHGRKQGFNNGSEPWNECFSSDTCAIVKYAPSQALLRVTKWRK